MPEDETRDPGDQFSQEHQGQKHGILQEVHTPSMRLQPKGTVKGRHSGTDQFEHPRAAAARGEAAEQAKDDDGDPRPDEDIWHVGAFLRCQREVGLQTHLPPHADRQQDHACELKMRVGDMSRFNRTACPTQQQQQPKAPEPLGSVITQSRGSVSDLGGL